jgi:hypothetical protein
VFDQCRPFLGCALDRFPTEDLAMDLFRGASAAASAR